MDNIFEVEVNPFSDEYLLQEIEFYDLKEVYERDGVKVIQQTVEFARCDDYLNKNIRISTPAFPLLIIDGILWMSLTYMELQSQFIPIEFAHGRVACGGLGLGYYVLRIMGNASVDSIDVYEKESRIIAFFKETFGDREGFEKLMFIEGDVRKQLRGKEYDFVYMDIYATLLPDEVVSDTHLFFDANEIEHYHFWGLEKILLDALNLGLLDTSEVSYAYRDYFRLWLKANDNYKMYACQTTSDFVESAVEALRKTGLLDEAW